MSSRITQRRGLDLVTKVATVMLILPTLEGSALNGSVCLKVRMLVSLFCMLEKDGMASCGPCGLFLLPVRGGRVVSSPRKPLIRGF